MAGLTRSAKRAAPAGTRCQSCITWLTASLPLLLITPILALMLNIATTALPALMIALLVGTMALTLLGIIGAALLKARRSSALIAILVLPAGGASVDFWRAGCRHR